MSSPLSTISTLTSSPSLGKGSKIFLGFLLTFLSIFQTQASTITINSYPAPLTVTCNGYGIDVFLIENWLADYTSIANNNATTDCASNSILFWEYDLSLLVPFMGCSDFMIPIIVGDDCGAMEIIDAQVFFTDSTPPTPSGNVPQVTNMPCQEFNGMTNWIDQIMTEGPFQDDCTENDMDIMITTDCSNCGIMCGESASVTFTATDNCGNSSQFVYTLNVEAGITIHNYPPPLTLACDGDGLDFQAYENWKNAYIDPANNNASTDCNSSAVIDWLIDDSQIQLYSGCGNFLIAFEAFDECGNIFYFDVPITFSDNTPPTLVPNTPSVTNAQCGSPEADVNNWMNTVTMNVFEDACIQNDNEITITNNCNGCSVACGSNIDVTFTATDNCGNSANYVFTLVVDNDIDGDGIDSATDNCPNIANPGQEDLDSDGIGNPCDSQNVIGELAEIESNLYLSAPYTGLVLTSQDGSCFILIVNNDGSLATLPIDCPQ